MEEQKSVGFRTSLCGFNKADVMDCIERISKEKEMLRQEADRIQTEMEGLLDERASLQEKLDLSEQETSRLREMAENACSLAAGAEEERKELMERLRRAEEIGNQFKGKLITKEQQLIALQRENDSLATRLGEQQQLLQKAQEAGRLDEKTFEDSVAAVRKDLAQVDEKITQLSENIRKTTESLSRTLLENQAQHAAVAKKESPRQILCAAGKSLTDKLLDRLADVLK